MACIAIEETLAEKALSFLRRMPNTGPACEKSGIAPSFAISTTLTAWFDRILGWLTEPLSISAISSILTGRNSAFIRHSSKTRNDA